MIYFIIALFVTIAVLGSLLFAATMIISGLNEKIKTLNKNIDRLTIELIEANNKILLVNKMNTIDKEGKKDEAVINNTGDDAYYPDTKLSEW